MSIKSYCKDGLIWYLVFRTLGNPTLLYKSPLLPIQKYSKSAALFPLPIFAVVILAVISVATPQFTSSPLNVMVFDLNGRQVYNQSYSSFTTEQSINLQDLQTGMYILKLNGEGLSHSRKIILN